MTPINKAIEICDKQTIKMHEMDQTIKHLIGMVGTLEVENQGLKQVIVMVTGQLDPKVISL